MAARTRPTQAVVGVISQNGNAYEEGFARAFWQPVWAYGDSPSAENEAALRPALERPAVEWQDTHGVPDPTTVDPDAWEHDLLAVWGRNDEIFGPDGAEAFSKHLPHARVELVDGGHFLLGSHLAEVVRAIRTWQGDTFSDEPQKLLTRGAVV